MMNKGLKFFLIIGLLVTMMSVFMCRNVVFAADTASEQLNEATEKLNQDYSDDSEDPYAILKNVMSILAWGGFAIAIFKLMQIGISFMTGVASRRSSAKDSILPWVIGCVICALFGTLGPWIISILAPLDSGLFS